MAGPETAAPSSATVKVAKDGALTVTAGDTSATGTWKRSGNTVEVRLGRQVYTYNGVSDHPESVSVAEVDKPQSGKFSVRVESSTHVVLTQTEWFDGKSFSDPSLDLKPYVYDCTKQ